MRSNILNGNEQPRRLEVRWLETTLGWGRVTVRTAPNAKPRSCAAAGLTRRTAAPAGPCAKFRPPGPASRRTSFTPTGLRSWKLPRRRAFTIIEMLVVVAIIGVLAAMALPHLSGMSTSNSMTLATQQLVSDAGLARQLAIKNRTTVYMVFSSPGLTAYSAPNNELTAYNNVYSNQYRAYALVSLRSVGDQPGAPFPQYLTPWKTLPDGVFIATYKFGANPINLATTNSLSSTVNYYRVYGFANNPLNTASPLSFPFPAVDAVTSGGYSSWIPLPYLAFTSSGQMASMTDEFIPLAHGSLFNFPSGVVATESPSSNSVNNATLIHIDALTGRAKIERNQF